MAEQISNDKEMKILTTEDIPNVSENVSGSKTESNESSQSNIAHEYKQEYKHYQKLSESYQSTLKSLDKLRDENVLQNDSSIITKLEGELKTISGMMNGSQIYMSRLFDQLSDESKEQYLKPEN